MPGPVNIFIGGAELHGWTEMTLTRSKANLTGSFDASVFFSYMPGAPVLTQVVRAQDVMVYIGGQLVFFGKVDKRKGSSVVKRDHNGRGHDAKGRFTSNGGGADGDGGLTRSVSIGPTEYTVKISARGQTKYLIDSSHQHPTTNMMQPTNRDVIEKLVEPWGIELDWKATEIKLDKVRFRDGAKVIDELQRIATENAHFIYETRDGKLRVTDDTGRVSGEALVLGDNILSFSAEQSEDKARSSIKVKGQRTKKEVWGEEAVVNRFKELKDAWVRSNIPYIVQHYGDATDQALERRAVFEMNKRASASKTISVDVFHVQPRSGAAWDVGMLHYVEIPPEGIFDTFECTEITYTVQDDKTLRTALTLAPPPVAAGGAAGGIGGGLLSGLSAIAQTLSTVAQSSLQSKKEKKQANSDGVYPDAWSSPDLAEVVPQVATAVVLPGLLASLAPSTARSVPLLTLPVSFKSETK